MPQKTPLTSAANIDSGIVKTIAALYASQADKEAEALHQQASIGMSARERLRLSHFIEEEIRRIHKKSKSHVGEPSSTEAGNPADWKTIEQQTNEMLHTSTRSVFDRLWSSLAESVATLLEGGFTILYFAFWIALAIVVFHTACRIIGF